MRYKFKHTPPTLTKYNCRENKIKFKKARDDDERFELGLTLCGYCGQVYDNGDTRFFETKDNMIDIACKPCLWKLGVSYCACCGEKIFGAY